MLLHALQSWQQYDLAALTAALRDAGLTITRAKVRPALGPGLGPRCTTNTFYLLDRTGQAPDPGVVQKACVNQVRFSRVQKSVALIPGFYGWDAVFGFVWIAVCVCTL